MEWGPAKLTDLNFPQMAASMVTVFRTPLIQWNITEGSGSLLNCSAERLPVL